MEKNKRRLLSLTHRSQFLELRASGRVVHVNSWMMVNVKENSEGTIRCGWTISRQIGSSVVRNRLRRWGREYLRHWVKTARSSGLTMNVIFKRKDKAFYKTLSHKEFDESMAKLVDRL